MKQNVKQTIGQLISQNKIFSVLVLFVILMMGWSVCEGFGQKKPGAFCERNNYRVTYLIDIFPKLTNDLNEVPFVGTRLPATIYRVKRDIHDDFYFFKGVYVEKVYSRNGNIELEFENYGCHLSKRNFWERINFKLKYKIWLDKPDRYEGTCLTSGNRELWIELTQTKYFGKVNEN